MNTIEAFEQWLTAEGYQPSTVVNYGKSIVALHRHGGHTLPLLSKYIAAAAAFVRWPGSADTPELREAATVYELRAREVRDAPTSKVQARRAAQAKRKRTAHSIGPDAFTRLAEVTWEHVQLGEACPIALAVLYATGLRVGDLLAVTRRGLSEGAQHGVIRLTVKGGDERLLPWDGAPDEWAHLSARFSREPGDIRTVADLLTGAPHASTMSGGAAYQRLDRALKTLADQAGVNERVHLHRLRRTVAIRALAQTQDIAAVQQLLGHRSINTTAGYVDEARPATLAGIQQNINPRKKP